MKIYLITNLINNKKYVGQTSYTIEKRFYYHSKCKKSVLSRAIRKYTKENFKVELIEESDCQETINFLEKYYIKHFNCRTYGYNMTDGGENPPKTTKESALKGGRKHFKPVICTNIKTQEKIYFLSIKYASEVLNLCKSSISFCCRYPNKRSQFGGYKWKYVDSSNIKSLDTYKQRKTNLGQKRSAEFCLSMSMSRKGKPLLKRRVPIIVENIVTGIKRSFDSINNAAEQLNLNRKALSNVLTGKANRTGNYKANYLNREV